MKVIVKHKKEEFEVHGPKTVIELLKELNFKIEEVLVIDRSSGKLLPYWEKLSGAETIEIRKVISGG